MRARGCFRSVSLFFLLQTEKLPTWLVCEECQNIRLTKTAASLVAFQTTPRPQRKSRQSLFIRVTNNLPRPRHLTTQIWLFISGKVCGAAPQRTHRGHGPTMRPVCLQALQLYCEHVVLLTMRGSKVQTNTTRYAPLF